MDLIDAHGHAESAIAAAETIHQQLEASLWGFIAVAFAEGWTEDEIDADLARFGFGLRKRKPAESECH